MHTTCGNSPSSILPQAKFANNFQLWTKEKWISIWIKWEGEYVSYAYRKLTIFWWQRVKYYYQYKTLQSNAMPQNKILSINRLFERKLLMRKGANWTLTTLFHSRFFVSFSFREVDPSLHKISIFPIDLWSFDWIRSREPYSKTFQLGYPFQNEYLAFTFFYNSW